MNENYLVILFIAFAAVVFLLIWLARNIEDPVEQAGRRGEEVATDIISRVLRKDDNLFTNVKIAYDGSRSEIDNLIINRYGVFIIEVKNYVGELVGDDEDYEWKKYKTTPGGDVYVKTVTNPIKQVKRQTYILSKKLKSNRINVWIDGYVLLLERNSPVEDDMILESLSDIDRAIHGTANQNLSAEEIQKIIKIINN